MKITTVIFTLIFCILWSCKLDNKSATSEKNKEELRTVKPLGKYYTKFDNDNCKMQIDSAKTDVKKGKLVYEDSRSWTIIRYDDEMTKILKEYEIEYKELGQNCTLEQECYAYYMDSIISQKFGAEFISQIEKKADSLFLSKWETKTYEAWEIDTYPVLKKGDAEFYIEQKIQFPIAWDTIPMKFKRQYIMVDVFINNNGKLVKWEFSESYNLKETNEKFLPKLIKQIEGLLKNMTDWTPAQLNNKVVNSRFWLDINLDKRD